MDDRSPTPSVEDIVRATIEALRDQHPPILPEPPAPPPLPFRKPVRLRSSAIERRRAPRY